MDIESIIEAKSEITHSAQAPEPIVLSTRIRLARNLEDYAFPGWAKEEQRREILERCRGVIGGLSEMVGSHVVECEELSDLEKQVLLERHLISRELAEEKGEAGVVISKDQSIAIMINEEDHIRMQVVKGGFQFKPVWKLIDAIDSAIEEKLDYAFSTDLGYLTACPTNIGTGMRGSVMMHLPGLVLGDQMEKVIRAVNQMGMAVRGILGEGSDASGSIFQISNQQTLGESEGDILKRLSGILETVVEHEKNARAKLLEENAVRLFDKIGRAYGILRNGYFVSSAESLNLLSLIRLAIDMRIMPEKHRRMVDRLFIECQPAHMQATLKKDIEPDERDAFRAYILREKFKNMAKPDFKDVNP